MSKNKTFGHNSKKSFLRNPVEHIDILPLTLEKLFPQ